MAKKPRRRYAGTPDAYLRAWGFAIHDRPKGGPAIWTRNGRLYTEDMAVEICDNEDEQVKAAQEIDMQEMKK